MKFNYLNNSQFSCFYYPEHQQERENSQYWLLSAFADDLNIVAPIPIAVRLFCRYAYLNWVHNKSIFKGAKNCAFSMGLPAQLVTAQLLREFQEIRALPTATQSQEYASNGEAAHRANNDYPTECRANAQGNLVNFSLLVEPEDILRFETHLEGVEGVELVGIPIEKEDSSKLTHVLMLKQLVKTRRVWAKTVNIIKKRHQHAQILQHCLRTRFHHFCRGIRPSKLLTPVSEAIRHLKERYPTDSEYQDLPEPAQGQVIIDYIDAWSKAEFLGITGQWKEEDIIAPNRLRATFPRRHGGMGFTLLRDILLPFRG